jgi:hypothetical protein
MEEDNQAKKLHLVPQEDDDDAKPPPEDAFSKAAKQRRDPQSGLVRLGPRRPSILPVCTPKPAWYVRASADPAMSNIHALVQAKELDDNFYFPETDKVIATVYGINPKFIRDWRLHLAVTATGVNFLWKNGRPGEDGALNSWHASGDAMIERAMRQWITLIANKESGGYDWRPADDDYGKPEFLQLKWEEILRLGFRRYLIEEEGMDHHPLIRAMRGKK